MARHPSRRSQRSATRTARPAAPNRTATRKPSAPAEQPPDDQDAPQLAPASDPPTPTGRLIGRTEPRLWTPPLRDLTRTTTHGYAVIDFNRAMGTPLLPWQEFAAIHALELDPSGIGYRFRTVLILVARQNGKSHLKRGVTLWRMYVGGAKRIIGVAQDLALARDQWNLCQETIHDTPELQAEWQQVRNVNGDEWFKAAGCQYGIKAANRRAGRGGSNDEVNIDELREQHDWAAWGAVSKTTMARPWGQAWCMSNAGDDESVVLNHLREAALSGRDPSIGIFEWSAPDGCDLHDPQAWAQANPGLGHTVSEQAIRSALGTDPAPVFRTEVLCQHVDMLADQAVTRGAWDACADAALTLDSLRNRTVAFIDIAPDNAHATLAVAAINPADDRALLEAVASWHDTPTMLAELPGWLDRIKPKAKGYFKTGPAAGLATDLDKLGFTPATSADQIGACQALVEHITGRRLLHAGDPLLTAHIVGAKKLISGDGYRFARRGAGHVDAAYAAAGAIHLARLLPPPAQHRVRWLA